jgi:hypothetical protein
VELVAARLHGYVEEPSADLTELGAEVAGLNTELLYGIHAGLHLSGYAWSKAVAGIMIGFIPWNPATRIIGTLYLPTAPCLRLLRGKLETLVLYMLAGRIGASGDRRIAVTRQVAFDDVPDNLSAPVLLWTSKPPMTVLSRIWIGAPLLCTSRLPPMVLPSQTSGSDPIVTAAALLWTCRLLLTVVPQTLFWATGVGG